MPTSQTATTTDLAPRLSRRAKGTLLVLCGALFLDSLDISMIGVALPSIRADLGMTTSELQWVVSAYVLGCGGFLLLGGRAADLFGRRKVFLVSLGVFVVASGLGGLADEGWLLIFTRFVKGVSAAFTAPAGLSIITTTFAEGPARNKALALYTATGAAGFSLGLVIGGALTQIGWRWTFFLPVAVALATLLAALRFVPADPAKTPLKRAFDTVGAVAITAAMLLLVFTVRRSPRRAGTRPARSDPCLPPVHSSAPSWRSSAAAHPRSCAWGSCAPVRWCARTSGRCRCSGHEIGRAHV